MSIALGEPMSAITGALGRAGVLQADGLLERLDAPVKSARVIALASAVAEVVADLERMELR